MQWVLAILAFLVGGLGSITVSPTRKARICWAQPGRIGAYLVKRLSSSGAGYPAPPSQIRAGVFLALGSSREYPEAMSLG